jgi:hypothetical protein
MNNRDTRKLGIVHSTASGFRDPARLMRASFFSTWWSVSLGSLSLSKKYQRAIHLVLRNIPRYATFMPPADIID